MRTAILLAAAASFLAAPELQAAEQPLDLKTMRTLEAKCLDCHSKEGLSGSRPDGRLVSAQIDPARYRKSIHYAKDITCLHCHPGANADYHPREGVKIEPCGSCHDHEDELADFKASAHGKLLADGNKDAPDCFSCHSNHYTATRAETESMVHQARIAETCGACHAAQAGNTAAGSWWAGGRVSAHGKADLSADFSTRVCTQCHSGQDTHKKTPPAEQAVCVSCHGAGESRVSPDGALLVGPVHLASPRQHGLALAGVRAAGLLAALAALAGAGVPVLGLAARRIRRRRKAALPGKPTEGEAAHGA